MLLKRLELQGFKSFADKTVLDFVDGSTAVVGPNGSGKSNISDAIRWVIGEMSAKSLRGSSMQDVIFAGTETRKPVNFAEVSLVLDNSTHIFDVEFDEVVVTRRLFRSGESVYQINRANCRLKDIHELFMDTGLGRDGYSIIGQGNVSQILSTKAEDRRSLFEEAAGVSKYKYRKEEAERKLRGVEENLVRINDITAELEGQRAPLKRQSEKAKKYLTLYGEYKQLDVNLSVITIDKNKTVLEETEKLQKSVEDELSELRKTESETERKITSLYDKNKEKDKEISEKNDLLRQAESEIMSMKNEISISENNIKNNHAMISRIDGEIISIRNKNEERRQNIELYNREISDKEQTAQVILDEFENMKSSQNDINANRDGLADKIEMLRSDIMEKLNSISSKKAQMQGAETLRKSYLERKNIVEAEIKSFIEGISNTKADIENCEKEISAKSEKLHKMQASVQRHEDNLKGLTENADNIHNSLSKLNVEYNSKISKKKILEGLENDYAGFAKSVKTVLKAPELKKIAMYGTVSGLIDVDMKFVTAIETALGGAMQNIVVETEDDAKTAIEFLRKSNAGRATFLPISSVKGSELTNVNELSQAEGFIGLGSALVKYDRKYDGIFKSLLGRVAIVDDIDNAIAMSRKFGYKFRVVTLKGDVLNAGGSMSGGSVNKQSGFLSRAAEIKQLSADIKNMSSQINDLEFKKQTCEKDMAIVQNQLSSYIPLVREYEDEILRLENTKRHLESTLKSEDDKNYQSELVNIEKQLSQSSEEIAVLLQSIRTLENETNAMQSNISEMTDRLDRLNTEKEAASEHLMDKTMELAAIEKDIKVLKENIEHSENDIQAAIEDIRKKEQDKERICVENDELYKGINEKTKLTEEVRVKSDTLKREIADTETEKAEISQMLRSIQNSNKDLTDKLLNLQQELSRLENRQEKINSGSENIISKLWDNYELTYNGALELKTEVENEKEAFERLSELKTQIKGLGSVNIDAIEEFKAVEERFEFLTSQKIDLDKSKNDLQEIIASMEDLMEEHFEKQFSDINDSFGKVFAELFGGGTGRLYLSDPNNVLESGIEIEAQLPGKGRQNINLYSGGEKSFIAIALLFAILRVKPAPFCILDEIDAALDDVNVSRFATYLKNYIEQTQFIIITHRRGTMEAANILYGVTMQEKGVSKLLSLHIDDVADDMVS